MTYLKNSNVKWLLSRSYGQGGTVALPSLQEVYKEPRGDFPAGVQDILDRLINQYAIWPATNSQGTDIEWCFLVGGPGNGKSEALRTLAGALNVQLPSRVKGEPAPRTVPTSWPSSAAPIKPGLEIVFINDASIPRQDALGQGLPGSLFLDLVDSMGRLQGDDTPVIVFGNINRGILVEEEAALTQANHPSLFTSIAKLARQVIEWLLNPPEEFEQDNSSGLQTIMPIKPKSPYYGQFRVPRSTIEANYDIVIHVVFLDTLSLLEPLPGGTSKAINFSDTGVDVAPYQTFGGFSDDRGATRNLTIAGKLLDNLVNLTRWDQEGCRDMQGKVLCAAFETCPFAQNARWLRTSSLQRRFLDTLRAIEIAAARRLTYRDLLGHLSLALLGQPEKSWLTDMHPCEWVGHQVRAVEEEHSKKAVAELISHRVYTNLFPSPDIKAWKSARVPAAKGKDTVYSVAIERMIVTSEATHEQAFERAFNSIDPARDVGPWKDDAREQVIDAVEALEIVPPSLQLLNSGTLPPEANSAIEVILDQVVIRDEIANELSTSSKTGGSPQGAPAQRAKLLRKWRNTLLLRQAGLALGEVAFKDALIAWLAEQDNALREDVPLELGRGIKTLLLPQASTSQLLLAPFRPRTYSLDKDDLPPNTLIVAVHSADLQVDIVPKGDMLVAEVLQVSRGHRSSAKLIASLVVDLAIAREALLHVREGTSSFTEIGTSAFARIERVRASLVGRGRLKQASVYFTDNLGNRYRVTNNPAGPTRLRVVAGE